jgi:hypothetical protein
MHVNKPRTRELDIASMDLPPHLYTYMLGPTCKFASAIVPRETLVPGPRRVYPDRFLHTRVSNVPFPWLKFVYAIATWKTKVGRPKISNFSALFCEGDWKAMWRGPVSMAELLLYCSLFFVLFCCACPYFMPGCNKCLWFNVLSTCRAQLVYPGLVVVLAF